MRNGKQNHYLELWRWWSKLKRSWTFNPEPSSSKKEGVFRYASQLLRIILFKLESRGAGGRLFIQAVDSFIPKPSKFSRSKYSNFLWGPNGNFGQPQCGAGAVGVIFPCFCQKQKAISNPMAWWTWGGHTNILNWTERSSDNIYVILCWETRNGIVNHPRNCGCSESKIAISLSVVREVARGRVLESLSLHFPPILHCWAVAIWHITSYYFAISSTELIVLLLLRSSSSCYYLPSVLHNVFSNPLIMEIY
jgi:hypothetical protein